MNYISFNIIESIYKITSKILLRHKVDVIFYYPRHFNRGADGKNPYFEPLAKVCRDNGIRYIQLEEPTEDSDKPKNKESVPADFLLCSIILIRKFFRSVLKFPYLKQERYTAFLMNILTLGKLKVKCYITISGSMEHFFALLNKNGKVYDYQHGIIYSWHWGYFEKNGKLRPEHMLNNLNFLLYGEGFLKSFTINNPYDITKRIHITGYPIYTNNIHTVNSNRNKILFSLQYTDDGIDEELLAFSELFSKALQELKNFDGEILFKHHPRYNNSYDISSIVSKNKNIKETYQSIDKLHDSLLLHITFYSTTAFEYAAYGVPTYFLFSEKLDTGKRVFYDEYEYPLYRNMDLSEVINQLSQSQCFLNNSIIIKEWYNRFYKVFDKELFLRVINSTIHENK